MQRAHVSTLSPRYLSTGPLGRRLGCEQFKSVWDREEGIAMPDFQIDHNKIRSILADAYVSLRQRRDDVIAAFAKLPDRLTTDEDIELAQGVVRELNETREAARRD